MRKWVQYALILMALGAMLFSSLIVIPGTTTQPVIQARPQIGAASGFTLTAYGNYTDTEGSCTFGEAQVTVPHTEYDVPQDIPITFHSTFLSYSDASGVPKHMSAALQIEETSPSVSFEPLHWTNVTESTVPVTVWANETYDSLSPMVLEFYITVSAECTGDNTWYNSTSPEKSITINPSPSVTISGSKERYVETNTTVNYTSKVCGGWTPYSYQWLRGSAAISGATASTYSKEYTAPGTYNIALCTIDATGYSIISNTMKQIVGYPPQVHLTSSAQDTQTGTLTQFKSNEIHGTGTVTISWYLNGTLISGQTGKDFNKTFSGPGDYTIKVSARDQVGTYANGTIIEYVFGPLSSSITASRTELDVGETDHFQFNPKGSTGIYPYENYTLTDRGSCSVVATGNAQQFNYTFGTNTDNVCNEDYALSWSGVSSDGTKTSATIVIAVNIDPSATAKAKYTSRDATQTDVLCAIGSHSIYSTYTGIYGGWKPYTIEWEELTSGNWTTIGNNTDQSYTFENAGTYTFRVHIIDGTGYQINSTDISVSVDAKLTLSERITPNNVPVLYGYSVCNQFNILSTATGGSTLESGALINGQLCYSNTGMRPTATFPHSMPSKAGHYNYTVQECDTNGAIAIAIAHFNRTQYDNLNIAYTVPSELIQGDMAQLSASATAPSQLDFAHTFTLIGYNYIWHIGSVNYSGQQLIHDFSEVGNQNISLTANATYQIICNGVAEQVHQSRTESFTINVLNQTTTSNIEIRQYKNVTSSQNTFSYWVSFKNSSYQEALITINNETTEPNVIPYLNGTIFIQQTISDSQFEPGTYSVTLTIINSQDQEGSAASSFTISLSQSSQFSIYTIASFFGGFYNFLIFIGTMGGLIIAYASLRESKEPPTIAIQAANGKVSDYRLQGSKIKTRGKPHTKRGKGKW